MARRWLRYNALTAAICTMHLQLQFEFSQQIGYLELVSKQGQGFFLQQIGYLELVSKQVAPVLKAAVYH